MMVSSFYWKQKAREALKGHWQTVLLICLVVNLPSLLTQGIASVTGCDMMDGLQKAVYASVSAEGAMDMVLFEQRLEAMMGNTGLWIMQGVHLLVWLVTPCLAMGMYAWMLKRLREQEGAFSDVFSRKGLFFRAMGLRLYVTLRIFLFMLPGAVLSVLSLIPIWTADTTSRISVLSAVNTSMTLTTASSLVTTVLMVLGYLYYAMADIIMADHTETGIRAAAKRSRELMRHHRSQLFFLFLSFLLWYILEIFLTGVVLNLFGSIASLMTEMLCSLALSAYLYTSVCAFYRTLLQEEMGEVREDSPSEGPDRG